MTDAISHRAETDSNLPTADGSLYKYKPNELPCLHKEYVLILPE